MKSNSFRTAISTAFAGLAAAWLLASCGGGGATANPNQGGSVVIAPLNGTFYAGVPSKIIVSGGRKPYSMTSSEPQVLFVPSILDGNELDVIPNNPGVVDTGLQPGELPRRTVTITARDTTGVQVATAISVGQNFLTGYGLRLTPTTCPTGTGTSAPTACPGGETAIQMGAVFNGSLYGNQSFTLQRIKGNFQLKHPVTGVTGDTVTLNSDHTGTIIGIMTVPANALTELAVIRTIHIPTGVYADQVFVISGTPLPAPAAGLTVLPSTITFTGALNTQCGVGSADFLVFDGVPPYTTTTTSNVISIQPPTSSAQPGRFTVSVASTQVCIDAPIVVTDAQGRRATVQVTTKLGSTAPPSPTPFSVSPGTMTLTCGAQGSVSVVGGSGNYTANSNHPQVIALIFGNTVSIIRRVGDGATVFPTTATVSVTDGASLGTVVVSVPANCP